MPLLINMLATSVALLAFGAALLRASEAPRSDCSPWTVAGVSGFSHEELMTAAVCQCTSCCVVALALNNKALEAKSGPSWLHLEASLYLPAFDSPIQLTPRPNTVNLP